MATTPKYVWIGHELRDSSEAVVPFLNAGLQYGFSVFEGIRCYETESGPAIFRLNEHAERLLDSARIVGFRDLPYSLEDIINAIQKTVAANELAACYIRPLIYLDGAMNMVVDRQ
jgi:branched-chain amino acid aminotransferase